MYYHNYSNRKNILSKIRLYPNITISILIWILLCLDNFIFCKSLFSHTNTKTQIHQLNQISDAHSQCLIQFQQQLSENQQDIDILRGHIQNIQHQISKIIYFQDTLNKKIEELLNNYNKTTQNINNSQQNLMFNNLEKLNNINNKEINPQTMLNKIDSDYKKAVALVLEKKQYNLAIQSFTDFIQNYPKSSYQPNAHYWLGQLYYTQGNKNDAAYHFAIVVKTYPKSSKAPDALLKIGIIMQETNQPDKAKTIYKQIGKLYPNSNAAKQAQKRLIKL